MYLMCQVEARCLWLFLWRPEFNPERGMIWEEEIKRINSPVLWFSDDEEETVRNQKVVQVY